jgi:hypothetical protein
VSSLTPTLVTIGAFACAVALTAAACSTFSAEGEVTDLGDAADERHGDERDESASTDASARDAASNEAATEGGHVAAYSVGCGLQACTGEQRCCFDHLASLSTAYHCANPNDACDMTKPQAEYECDDTDDCVAAGKMGNVCCGTLIGANSQYYLGSAHCVLAASCGAGHDEVRLCNRSLDGQCPATKLCVNVDKYSSPDDKSTWTVSPSFAGCER